MWFFTGTINQVTNIGLVGINLLEVMNILDVFLLNSSQDSLIYMLLLKWLFFLDCPTSSIHEELILHFDTFGTALSHNAYLSRCEEAATMYSIAFIIFLTTAFMCCFVIRTSVDIFVFHICFIWDTCRGTWITFAWEPRISRVPIGSWKSALFVINKEVADEVEVLR